MKFRGMRFRLTLMLIAIALPILVGAAVFSTISYSDAHYETFEQRLTLGTGTMAAMLKTRSEDQWDAVLKDALGADAQMRWAVVTGASGTPVAVAEVENLAPDVARMDPAQGAGLVQLDGGFVRVVAPMSEGAKLTIGYSDEAYSDTLGAMSTLRPVVGLVALLLFGFGGWIIGGRFTAPMRDVSDRLTKVSQDLLSAARAREASAAEEAAAVEETRRTMDMLLSSAQKIADSASAVLGNAERTLDGNRDIADRIELLNRHAEKVAEILASIMQVADRTDLLALNAALEGTKAGEAGKGFTLVAKEMRRLAENVMDSVEGIRRLMRDVRTAGQGAVEASHDGTRFSEETTRSVREIALVTQQQRKATEQVSRSMDEMTELLNHAMADIKQTTRSAAELSSVSELLAALVTNDDDKLGEKKKG